MDNAALLTVIHQLGMGKITGGETLFLFRRLRYSADYRRDLAELYSLDEITLSDMENSVLRRLPFDGVRQVASWLDGWAGDEYIHRLTQIERSNLRIVIDEAILLQTQIINGQQLRPSPHLQLAGNEKQTLKLLQAVNQPPVRAEVQPSQSVSQHKTAKSSTSAQKHINSRVATKSIKTSDNQLILSSCPSFMAREMQPMQLLEKLFNLYLWLHEPARSVKDLRQYVIEQWHLLSRTDFQKALDLFYVLGIITLTSSTSPNATVMPVLPVDLNVSQFRRYCAEKFTQRIQGNSVLLTAIDHLNCASLDQIKRTAFGHARIPDIPLRLIIWEALGIIQRQKKDNWKITQAGSVLVATLPSVQLIIANEPVSMPTKSDDDWLDVL